MRFVEKVLFIFVLLALASELLDVSKHRQAHGAVLALLAAIAALSLLYLLLGFLLYNGIRLRHVFNRQGYIGISTGDIIMGIVAGIIHSAMLVGVIARIQRWGGGLMTVAGGFVLSLLLAGLAYLAHSKNRSVLLKNIIVRTMMIVMSAVIIVVVLGMQD